MQCVFYKEHEGEQVRFFSSEESGRYVLRCNVCDVTYSIPHSMYHHFNQEGFHVSWRFSEEDKRKDIAEAKGKIIYFWEAEGKMHRQVRLIN